MKIEKESKVKEPKKEVTKTEPEDLAYAKKLAQLKKQYRKNTNGSSIFLEGNFWERLC